MKEYWKGEKVGNMMMQAQVLKKAFPQYFEEFMVCQQPAAMRDAVIVAWNMEEMHIDHPYVMQQHDLLGAQSTAEVKDLRFLLNIPDAIICGEMTAPTQCTDIMIANPVQEVGHQELPKIRQWMKEFAKKNGEAEVNYKVGLLEIILIADAIERHLRKWHAEYDFILAAARQGGHLAYLPDLEKKKLVPVEAASTYWPVEMVKLPGKDEEVPWTLPPLGGKKLKKKWLWSRYEWRDENGKPLKPNWEEMDTAADEKMENMVLKQRQFENEEAKILVTAEEQEIFDEHAEELQKHPSARKMQYTQMWEALKEAGAITARPRMKRLQKNRKKSERIKIAKMGIPEEKIAKCLKYMDEGWTPEELAGRVIKTSCKKKRYKSGAQKRKPNLKDAKEGDSRHKWPSGAFLKKHAFAVSMMKAKKKKAQMEKEAEALDPLHAGAWKGKTVALKKDMCIALPPIPSLPHHPSPLHPFPTPYKTYKNFGLENH